MPPSGNEAAEKFAVELVQAYRRHGAPAHRLEQAMQMFATKLKLDTAFHVFPTAIMASSQTGRVIIISTTTGPTELDRLCAVDQVAQWVAEGLLSSEDGLAKLHAIESAPDRYGRWAQIAAWSLASGSSAVFFGGGSQEALLAAGIGGLCGILSSIERLRGTALTEVICALVAGFAIHILPGTAAEPALLGGLVSLYPGMTLTVGLTDLATRHVLAGSGGLFAAAVTLLELGFGVALGTQLGEYWFGPLSSVTASTGWSQTSAVIMTALAFSVVLHARRRDVGWIVVSCAIALYADQFAALWVENLSGGIGAFAVTLFSNALSRWRNSPAAVTQVAGLLVLVPGSLGFRAVQAMLAEDVISGVEAAFSTLLAAMALVAGTLLANAIVPPRRIL